MTETSAGVNLMKREREREASVRELKEASDLAGTKEREGIKWASLAEECRDSQVLCDSVSQSAAIV